MLSSKGMILAVVCGCLAVAPPPAGARPSTNAGAESWRSHITSFYRDHGRLTVSVVADRDSERPDKSCPGIETTKFEPWRLLFTIATRNRHVFAPVWGNIRRLAQGTAGYDDYRAATGMPAPHGCISKSGHLIVRWGEWQAELFVPCRAGALDSYEVADFLVMLQTKNPSLPLPAEAIWSACGGEQVAFVPVPTLIDHGTHRSKIGGRDFPAARGHRRPAPK